MSLDAYFLKIPHSKCNLKKKTASGKHASDIVESTAAKLKEANRVEGTTEVEETRSDINPSILLMQRGKLNILDRGFMSTAMKGIHFWPITLRSVQKPPKLLLIKKATRYVKIN